MNPPLQHPRPLPFSKHASQWQAPLYNATDTSILFPSNHEASQTMLLDMSCAPYITGSDDTTSFFSPPHPPSTIGSPLMSLPVFAKTGNTRRGPLSSTRSPSSSKLPEEEGEEVLKDDRHTMKEIVTRLDKVGLRESLREAGKQDKENRNHKGDFNTLNTERYDDTVGASVLFKLDKEMRPLMAESFMVMPSSSDTSSSTLLCDTSDVQPPPEPAWKARLAQQPIQRGFNHTPNRTSIPAAGVAKERTPTAPTAAAYKPLLPKSISTPVISRVSAATATTARAVKGRDEHTPIRRITARTGQDSAPGEARSAVKRANEGRTPLAAGRPTAAASRSPVKVASMLQGTPEGAQPNIARSRYGRSPMAATSASGTNREGHTPLGKLQASSDRDSTPRRTLPPPPSTAGLASRSPRKVPLPASPSLPTLAQLKTGQDSAVPTSRSPGLARSRSIASSSSSRLSGARNGSAVVGADEAPTTYSRDFFKKMRGNKAPPAAMTVGSEKAGTTAIPSQPRAVQANRRGIPASASSTSIAAVQAGSPRSKPVASASSPRKTALLSAAPRPGFSREAAVTRDDVLARAAKRAEMRRAAETGQAGPSSRQSAIGPVRNSVAHSSSSTSLSNLRRSIPRPESSAVSTIPSSASSKAGGSSTANKRDEYRSIPRSRSSTRDLSKSTSSLASSTSSTKLAQASAPIVPSQNRLTGLSRSTRVPTTTSSISRHSEVSLPPLPSSTRPLPNMPSRRSGLPVSQSSSSISSLSTVAGPANPRQAGMYSRNRDSVIGGQSGIGRLPKSYSAMGVSSLAG